MDPSLDIPKRTVQARLEHHFLAAQEQMKWGILHEHRYAGLEKTGVIKEIAQDLNIELFSQRKDRP